MRNLELIFENMEGKAVRISLEAPVEPARSWNVCPG